MIELFDAELHEIGADDRGDDADRADRERIDHRVHEAGLAREEDRAEHHRGDDGHRIGLEQVGRHARAVADVVADVVGDGRRVARIVFRNAGFDLAHEVGADVGALVKMPPPRRAKIEISEGRSRARPARR